MRRALVLVAAGLVIAGCGSEPSGAAGAPAEDYLQIIVGSSDAVEITTYGLSCDGAPSGSHPEPDAACAHLDGMDDAFAPLPDDVACTEQYGGPQTADVIGRWDGEAVDVGLSRTDGCRIAQWDALGPLLPGPVG